jgi:hypothetical protein
MTKRKTHNKLSAAQIGRLEKVRKEAQNVVFAIDSILVVGYGENVKDSAHAISHRTWLETVIGRLGSHVTKLVESDDVSEESCQKAYEEERKKHER